MALTYSEVLPFIQDGDLQTRTGVAINKWAQSNAANADAPTATLAKSILQASPAQTAEHVYRFTRAIVIANTGTLNAPYTASAITDAAILTAIGNAATLLK